MRILLIQPPICSENSYPLGLAYLAASLKETAHQVLGYDCNIRNQFNIDEVLIQKRIDVVGISIWAVNRSKAVELARCVKEKHRLPIIAGGPDVTLHYDEIMQYPEFDYAVVGEGEKTLVRLLDQLDGGGGEQIPGVVYRKERTLRYMPSDERVDLNQSPFPDRELFPIGRYQTGTMSSDYPYAPLITSRGCPNLCRYCSAPQIWKGAWRGRDPENVIAEMEYLRKNYGIASFHLEDDNLLADQQRFVSFLKLLVQQQEMYRWECCNGIRPEQLTDELIFKMAAAGCTSVSLSIETLNPNLQKWSDRIYSFEQIAHLVKVLRKAGIKVGGYFIIGMESEEEWVTTLRAIPKLGLHTVKFSILQNLQKAPEKWWYRMRIFSYLFCYLRPEQILQIAAQFRRVSSVELFTKKILEIIRRR